VGSLTAQTPHTPQGAPLPDGGRDKQEGGRLPWGAPSIAKECSGAGVGGAAHRPTVVNPPWEMVFLGGKTLRPDGQKTIRKIGIILRFGAQGRIAWVRGANSAGREPEPSRRGGGKPHTSRGFRDKRGTTPGEVREGPGWGGDDTKPTGPSADKDGDFSRCRRGAFAARRAPQARSIQLATKGQTLRWRPPSRSARSGQGAQGAERGPPPPVSLAGRLIIWRGEFFFRDGLQ